MSLLPFLFENHLTRPIDQHFGLGMDIDDLLSSMAVMPACSRHYCRPWRSQPRSADSGSRITADKDKYQVCLDVKQFAPEEITVKTVGNQVVVEGKHEEKQDDHGHISRHFVRKYELPKDYRMEDVVSTLSSDGVLSITAPRPQQALPEGERAVPIKITGPAHKSIETKEAQKMDS